MKKGSQDKATTSKAWEWPSLGLAFIALGLYALFSRDLESARLAGVLGLSSILAGALYLALYLKDRILGQNARVSLAKVLTPLLAGLCLLFEPAWSVKYLLVLAGLLFVVNALFISLAALVLLAFGLVTLFAPKTLETLAETFVGAGLILNGLLFFLKLVADILVKRRSREERSPLPEGEEK